MYERVQREEGVRALTTLWNLEYPEYPNTEEEFLAGYRHLPADAPEFHFVVKDNGRPVAGLFVDSDEEDRPYHHLSGDFLLDPALAEEHLAGGVEVMRNLLSENNLDDITVWARDTFEAKGAFLQQSGFEISQVVNVSRLDLTQFDPHPFAAKVNEVELKYRLVSAADLDEEGLDWIPLLWESTFEIAEDIPRTLPLNRPLLDEYRELVRSESVIYQTDTMMIALDGQRIVGYSRVTLSDALPTLALTGMSGAVRSHRRQGIVTALKVIGIQRMIEKGIQVLQTDNDENNPMYQLNLRLGFRPCWKWQSWRLSRTVNPR